VKRAAAPPLTARAEPLEGTRRKLPPVVIPVLLAIAIAAYLIGSHGSSTPPPVASLAVSGKETRIAAGSSVLLEYPAGWRTAGPAPTIPGLAVAHPLLLAPGGDSAHAGLLTGQLPAGQPSPLPASFLALLHAIPLAEVVGLENLQAYRYSNITGYQRALDIYVIPAVGGSSTALICYAASGYAGYLQQCEQIVAKVALVSQTSDDLSPNAAYASQLSELIAGLEWERMRLRAQMPKQPTMLASLATTLAKRFAGAAVSVTALEPPVPASAAQAVLASALLRARAAYAAFATAAKEALSLSGPEARVNEAEAGVDAALENFALLGYTDS
jgi:hypothetical protein